MYGKIQITGTLEVITGMHIGGSSAFAAIGSVDSPIIKDARTNLPMIPGSSLKGKIRTLLAKKCNPQNMEIKRADDDAPEILRLFGSAKKKQPKSSRVIFSDMVLSNSDDLYKSGVQGLTEVKFENTINRLTAVANPRQIERAIRGSEFPLDLIYEVNVKDEDIKEVKEDFSLLAEGMKLLEYDYLGGNGSRGYGKVRFKNLHADAVVGDIKEDIVDTCNEILKDLAKERS